MYKAFFDASGHHKGDPLLSVAACVARVEDWNGFERQWQPVCNKAGFSFHGKDKHTHALRPQLLKVVEKWVDTAVVISVNAAEFEATMGKRYKSVMGGAVTVAAFTCAQSHSRLYDASRRRCFYLCAGGW